MKKKEANDSNTNYTTNVGLWSNHYIHGIVVVAQLLSCVPLLATLWTAACQASLSFPISWSLLKLTSIASVIPSNHLILCHLLLLLPSVFLSIKVFSNESALCIRWPECWSFSISPSNEYSGLISFRIDWFDLLAVQGTLKSLLQQLESVSSLAPNLLYQLYSNCTVIGL